MASITCVGFLIVFKCAVPEPAVVSDFCQIAGPEVAKLKNLSATEIAGLTRPRKEAIVALKENHKRLCK